MNQLKNITDEIIQNKKELSQSEKIYGKLFNTFSDGVYILDKSNYQILDANPSACNIYGYSLEEIRELKVTDLSAEPKKTLDGLHNNIIQIPYRLHKKKNGTIFPVEINVSILKFNETVVHIVNVRDITERIKIEKKLQNIASIPRLNPNPIMEILPSGEFIFYNAAAEEITKLTGVEDISAFLPKDFDVLVNILGPNNPGPVVREVNIKNLWFEEKILYAPEYGTLRIYCRDITVQKQIYKELHESERELKKAQYLAGIGYFSYEIETGKITLSDNIFDIRGSDKKLSVLGYKEFIKYFSPGSVENLKNAFENAIKTGGSFRFENEIIRKDNKKNLWINIIGEHQLNESGKPFIKGVIQDLTERKEVERKVENSLTYWKNTFKAINDHIWLLDLNGTILQTNNGSEELFCDGGCIEVGRKCHEIMHDAKSFIPGCPYTALKISHKREVWEEVRNGKTYSVTVDPVLNDIGELTGAVHIMSDITKLKEAENQMRDFANHLQKSLEKERMAIARLLHDNFGQSFTALKMEISSLEKKLQKILNINDHPEIPEKINSIKTILDDSVALTGKISMELRPQMLDMLGLVPAIEWLVKDISKKSGIEMIIDKKIESFDINQNNSIEVYRILQEAFTNIVRHANATTAEIILTNDLNGYLIKVIDNGRGIKEEEIKLPNSLGLLGMRERASTFGGTIEISGKPNQGTELIIMIPNNTI